MLYETDPSTECIDFLNSHSSGLPLELWKMKLPELCALDNQIPNFYKACCAEANTSTAPATTLYPDIESSKEALCQLLAENSTNHSIYVDFCLGNVTQYRYLPAHGAPPLLFTYIFVSILCPIGILANSLIIVTIFRLKRLHNTTGYCICNLAIADILYVLTIIIYLISLQFESTLPQRVVQYLVPSFDIFLGSASILHVALISVERAVAIAFPFLYPRYLRGKRSILFIKVLWSYCFLLFFLALLRIPIKNDTYAMVVFFMAVTLSFLIPFCFIVVSYSVIVFAALNIVKKEQKLRRHVVACLIPTLAEQQNSNSRGFVRLDEQDQKALHQQKIFKHACRKHREVKVTLNVSMLVLPFLACWSFFIVCNVYEVVTRTVMEEVISWFINYLPFLISCLNPVVYLLFTRSLRKESAQIMQNTVVYRKLRTWRRDSIMTTMSLMPTSLNSRRSSEQQEEARHL